MEKYYSDHDFFYSLLYGNGVYQENEKVSEDATASKPIIRNVITGETYILKCFPDKYLSHYKKLISYPPDSEIVLWPSDIVQVSAEEQEKCTLFVGQRYTDGVGDTGQKCNERNCALLFYEKDYSKCKNLNVYLNEIKENIKSSLVRSWENQSIQNLMVQLVKTIIKLNACGYCFFDFHVSDFHQSAIWIREDKSVFLEFTNLIFDKDDFDVEEIEPGEYPIEFIEPSFQYDCRQKKECKLNYRSQNYSLAAMLFYLCFDRYAYESTEVTVSTLDDTKMNHYTKFRDYYHPNPGFIFDPELDLLDKTTERSLLQSWEECPRELKRLFSAALKNEQMKIQSIEPVPIPSEWLKCFQKLGW